MAMNQTVFRSEIMQAVKDGCVLEKVLITPARAEILLERNIKNRRMKKATVRSYADVMAKGGWGYSRIPIIFSETGALLDGQHRLMAIIKSGYPFEIDLAFGAPDESFIHIDQGAKRLASDILAMNGVKYHKQMAAAARWIMAIESGRLHVRGHTGQIPVTELLEAFESYDGLTDGEYIILAWQEAKIASASMMLALWYLCRQKDADLADKFFLVAATGENLRKGNPALALRKRLIANTVADDKMSNRKVAAITVRAWNAYHGGRELSSLRHSDFDEFPAIK